MAMIVCLGPSLALAVMGAPPEAVGTAAVVFAPLLFVMWEFSRWRIRRANPIAKPPDPRLDVLRDERA
jgi:hypothetical protein